MIPSSVPWQYVAHRPYVWYQADLPGYAQAAFEVAQTLVNVGVPDPTRGYHSMTQSRKGVADSLFNLHPSTAAGRDNDPVLRAMAVRRASAVRVVPGRPAGLRPGGVR